uniref:Uncharacterized protein n=1 Tax=Oryza brachyantha TaxID=4533 RepID=J3MLZ3_ORYBR
MYGLATNFQTEEKDTQKVCIFANLAPFQDNDLQETSKATIEQPELKEEGQTVLLAAALSSYQLPHPDGK